MVIRVLLVQMPLLHQRNKLLSGAYGLQRIINLDPFALYSEVLPQCVIKALVHQILLIDLVVFVLLVDYANSLVVAKVGVHLG